ncbi:MAG: aminotransferase class I/II-fold pyridoxal phosphate-dependent enzyme [Chloroflexi bacterium]|nr:aminotransferase class I/II-fold pyridoxal phosphate-dependent enzyme [Chloroflexota bacterium]
MSDKDRISQFARVLKPSGIRKYFDLAQSMSGVISLGVGEPDYTSPWRVRQAAIKSLEMGQTAYTSNSGMLELRKSVCKKTEEETGICYDPYSEVFITVGVSEGLDTAFRAMINPGDEVLVPDPHYVSYDACAFLAGGTPIYVPTVEQDNFEISYDLLKKYLSPKTKLLVMGYPANPTGAILPKAKVEEVTRFVKENDIFVISDEIYSKLTYGQKHYSIVSQPDMKERTILLNGFSKAYAMTGFRIAYALGPKDIIAAMAKIHQYTIMCAPTMSQIAAIEALRQDDDVATMVDDYNRRRNVMVSGLRSIGFSCFEPKGAFYAFPSIAKTGLSSEEFAEKLLMEERVAVVPGEAFGQSGAGHIRCCYATAISQIEEALMRIEHFARKYF